MIDKKIRRLLTLKATKPMLGLTSSTVPERPRQVKRSHERNTDKESSFVRRRVVPAWSGIIRIFLEAGERAATCAHNSD